MFLFRASTVLAALLFACACSGSGAGVSSGPPLRAPMTKPKAGPPASTVPAFSATRIAVVPSGTFGPYVGVRDAAMIAAWAADGEGKRRWYTVGLDATGTPARAPVAVADAAADVDLVAVRPSGGKDPGFFLVSTSREFSGERVDAFALGPSGELRGGPTPLAQALSDVVWIDVVPTASGGLVLWAVRREDRADLFGIELGPSSDPKDRPVLLVPDARAWQVAAFSGGAAIAAATLGKQRNERGPLRLTFVDANAHADKKLLISDGAGAEPDIDLVRIGDRLVVAWSERRGIESRLTSAVVDSTGNLVKPAAPLGPPFGPQSLFRLIPPFSEAGPAFVAWENALDRSSAGHVFRLGTLSRDGALGPATALLSVTSDRATPELAASARGLAALTLAPLCERGVECESAAAVPTYVELDGNLSVVASEPLRLDALGGDPADLAWGLWCGKDRCLALAAAPASPAPVFAVRLSPLGNRFRPAARRASDEPPPHVASVEAIAESESVAETAGLRSAQGSLLAWVTYLDPTTPFSRTKSPAPDGKYEAVRAVVRVQNVPDQGPPGEPSVISYRAHSLGGVALSPGDSTRGESLLAWVGIDNKQPQIFLTLLGPGGRKTSQKMLTHSKAAPSDVALAWVGDGWVVAWIDDRTGASQVYAEKVDRTLVPVVPERRLGSTASVQTGVQLLARGDHVFVAWSDTRGPEAGPADLFAVRLSAKDLAAIGPAHVVVATPAHSRSPSLAPLGEGAAVAWIEEPPPGSEGIPSTAMVARLDSGAEMVSGSATSLRFAGSPEGIAVECRETACRIAAVVATDDAGALDVVEWGAGAEPRARRLLSLGERPRDALSPLSFGPDLFVFDEVRAGNARLRRVGVTWK